MIDASKLLADLKRQLTRLEADLRDRIDEVPALKASLQDEWQSARNADRTAETFETWADQLITQAGVHWLLSCVFIRFVEDNQLVDRPWLSGTHDSGCLALARDRHEAYFRAHPAESDREYLLAAFREAGALPGLHTFFDEAHNPVFRLGISGDAAMALRQFWQQVDPNTGALLHDFTDPEWNTRFLGDLYQDLSEATRKRYALLQTPEFVEEFILDRTLNPAIHEFGFREVRLIDPTCGSGHFLLGGFHRLVDEWGRNEPTRNRRDVAQKALDAVSGVDLNPFAVAITRFRLLVAALKVSEVRRLSEAPDFKLNVAIGDSLLHGTRFGLRGSGEMFAGAEHYAGTGLAHAYASEDLAEVQRILGRQYHAVVGNPPYITVKDKALNAAYRARYVSCHMKYSLGCPFTERFFELAMTGSGTPAGYVGLITTNSFMKREFGSKLIEEVLPRLDLTHIVDTSGAYIPGHGTPTVILFGRHRLPLGDAVRAVMGIKGEPRVPDHAADGLVWTAILSQIDDARSSSEFVSTSDTPRDGLAKHPWSIGGGGAAELKEQIEEGAAGSVQSFVALHRYTTQVGDRLVTREVREIGVFGMTNADDVMLAPRSAFRRAHVEDHLVRRMVEGDSIRDWRIGATDWSLFPYIEDSLVDLDSAPGLARWIWPSRTVLGSRATFGKSTYFDEGRPWWAWHQIALRRLIGAPTIAFSEVSTHNHFLRDDSGCVYKNSAPMMKLAPNVPEDEQLGLLGLLNSSTVCYWLQQVCHNKGRPGAEVAGADERYEMRYCFNASNVAEVPVPKELPVQAATVVNRLTEECAASLPSAYLTLDIKTAGLSVTREVLDELKLKHVSVRAKAIAWQEELDWQCYLCFGLTQTGAQAAYISQEEPPPVNLGERAFEIVLARRVAAGLEDTTWFERHGSTPTTEIPARWPAAYRDLVQRRIALIESDRNIGLIERPEYKRRWNTPAWATLEQDALRAWLLDRLEDPMLWPATDDRPPQITTAHRLADALRSDAGFTQVAALYAQSAGLGDVDLGALVAELVATESVPFLPVLRYKDSGLRKRAQWEDTWALQRREDAGESVGKIPVPPDYKSADFIKADFWRLRGGLDVPKERWVSYPGCERGADTSLPIAWAGWNHLQQATALAAYYLDVKDNEGWLPERLQPLLAGLLELVPWLKQWHNDVDPASGERLGDYYAGFVADQARDLGWTLDDLRAWKPPAAPARRGRRRTAEA